MRAPTDPQTEVPLPAALPFLRAGRCLRVFPLEPIEPSVAPQITDFVLFPCLAET